MENKRTTCRWNNNRRRTNVYLCVLLLLMLFSILVDRFWTCTHIQHLLLSNNCMLYRKCNVNEFNNFQNLNITTYTIIVFRDLVFSTLYFHKKKSPLDYQQMLTRPYFLNAMASHVLTRRAKHVNVIRSFKTEILTYLNV